ncbi:MAG: hypothetical protein L3J95_03820 [Thermoplasmata archaeon]|nr:hypothetical protein [Thermoplasmata archaeon]MCI4359535.1 hypothetical protein [Thermoplasmata archaeon]
MTDRRRNRATGVDVYLFPAVVGGGLGDVTQVRGAGERLLRAGFPVRVFRSRGRSLPASATTLLADSGFRWDRSPVRAHARALTISSCWGVSAAPARDEPFGRAGDWARECEQLESSYGASNVVHVSLEEFARTLTSREETVERYREGGRRISEVRRHLASARGRAEVREFHDMYRKFRAFDRPNLLHLFATFHPSVRFAREYPEAVQIGPLWPARPTMLRPAAHGARRTWLWYASASTSPRIATEVLQGLTGARPPIHLDVRSNRVAQWPTLSGEFLERQDTPRTWRRRVRSAEVRIVTGSRTLLEALSDGVPFLYFNGLIGSGPGQRRHRPEKIRSLIAAWRSEGIRGRLTADLDAFSKGRRVREVVRRAASDPGFRREFRPIWRPKGFPEPFADAGNGLVHLTRRWARSANTAVRFVAVVRSESKWASSIGESPPEAGRV